MLRLGLNDCCLSQRKANLSIADYRQEILDYMIMPYVEMTLRKEGKYS